MTGHDARGDFRGRSAPMAGSSPREALIEQSSCGKWHGSRGREL